MTPRFSDDQITQILRIINETVPLGEEDILRLSPDGSLEGALRKREIDLRYILTDPKEVIRFTQGGTITHPYQGGDCCPK